MQTPYLQNLFQQFQTEHPIYSEQIIVDARESAKCDRKEIQKFLSQQNFREEHFLQWIDLTKNDFASGMDIAFDLNRSGANLIDAPYILNNATKNGLIFFYQYLPNYYYELCNQQNNPFWLFPLREEYERTSKLEIIKPLSPLLQGYFLHSLWIEECHESSSFKDLLSSILELVDLSTIMVFLGEISEPLIRNSFDTSRPKQMKVNEQLLNRILQWMAQSFRNTRFTKEILEIYLHHLQGRVNRENWLAALYFANKIEELDHTISNENAQLLRKMIVESYSTIWVSSNSKDNYYISGSQSIALITELAHTLLNLEGIDDPSQWWHDKEIVPVHKLWQFRNTHDYSTYINKRRIIFVHCLLLAKMMEQMSVSQKDVFTLHRYICNVFRQTTDHHVFSGEELVVEHLLESLGIIYEKNNVTEELATELISHVTFPGYALHLLKGLSKKSFEQLRFIIEEKVNFDLPILRKQERINLALHLYNTRLTSLCCELIKISNLAEQAITERSEKVILIYASAVLQSIPSFSSEDQKIEYLNDAFGMINKFQQKYPYTNNVNLAILRGYLVKERYEAKITDLASVMNDYRFLASSKFDPVKSIDAATLAYVKLLLLVYLIHENTNESIRKQLIGDYQLLIQEISPLEEIEGTKLLMQAWIMDEGNMTEIFTKLKLSEEQIKDILPFMPKPLQQFGKKLFKEVE